jgi:hypothetical protein
MWGFGSVQPHNARVEMLVVGVVRVLGSLPVLRWAFAGALIAILVDFSDLFLRNLLDLGGIPDYQRFDKLLDLVYMAAFLVVALGWRGLARDIAVGLFAFRMVGLAAFEVTDARGVLLAFPNVFEFWFVYVAAVLHWRPRHLVTLREAAIALVPLTALKLFQEYALHWGKWLDGFTAVEAVEAIWDWATAPF